RRPPLFKGSLLRIRWTLGDPDRLLDRWMPAFNFLFTRPGVLLACAMFAIYFVVLAAKWTEFTAALGMLFDFHASTLLLMYAAFMLVAAVHELGHAFACKHFGGQVHEIGAMLLYFDLAFFCNVNDAWSFPERRARLWVSAAGSWIQLILASVAGLVWWATPPGTLLADFAMATFVMGGILTVLFNINPLLPLDGYFALMDYLEVANLRPRAFAYLGWTVKHRIFGMDLPALAALYSGFVLYAFAGLLFGWLSRALGVLGVIIFAVGLWLTLRQLIREFGMAAMAAARRRVAALRGRRRRTLPIAAAAVAMLGAVMPWPITVTGRFAAAPTVFIPITVPEDGMVDRVLVREGTRVTAGMPLMEVRNLGLERRATASGRVADSLGALEAQARVRGQGGDAMRLQTERLAEASRLGGMRTELA